MRVVFDILPFASVIALGLVISQFFRVGLIVCASLVISCFALAMDLYWSTSALRIVTQTLCLNFLLQASYFLGACFNFSPRTLDAPIRQPTR